jgi:hypothetical protein
LCHSHFNYKQRESVWQGVLVGALVSRAPALSNHQSLRAATAWERTHLACCTLASALPGIHRGPPRQRLIDHSEKS